MLFTRKLQKAINISAVLHREHLRKDTDKTPYITHPFSVMIILSEITSDEDILIAGLFHDTLEDVPNYNYEKLISDTNERTAKIVKGVTEDLNPNIAEDMQLPWLIRKENYLKNLEKGSEESLIVSLADKIHNIESILMINSKDDFVDLTSFKASLKNMVWFFDEIEKIAKNKLNEENILLNKFSKSLSELKNI